MNVTTTPAPKSSILLEVELPPERLDKAMTEAVRRLARRTRVPGFRPGKAPRIMLERVLGPTAILDEAVDQLVGDAYREAILDSDIFPLTNPDVEVVQAEEGQPVKFKATVQVRPEVVLGDYKQFNFRPEIEATDDEKVDKVVDELRDQHASLQQVTDRPTRNGDYVVVGFTGTRDGVPFDGGSAERMPLILGEERLIPGFEEHLVGLEKGGRVEFDIVFPDDYHEETLKGQPAHFDVELREHREKVQPELTDDFAKAVGGFEDVAAMRADIRTRLERSALDRARHDFADRIIEYAVANATIDLPDVLVDQEVEVMHDELRSALGRQGITEDAYLKAIEKTDAELHAEFRPQAEKRVKVLLTLSKIAETEGVDVSSAQVEAEVAKSRERYAADQKLIRYIESERGHNYIRSTIRRSQVVEHLVDEWLAAHPEQPPIPHLEESEMAALDGDAMGSAAAVEATDPGSVIEPAPAGPAATAVEAPDAAAAEPTA